MLHLTASSLGALVHDAHGLFYLVFGAEAQAERVAGLGLLQDELERFIRLVQVHAAACGECCIQKITFNRIPDGMQLVAGIQS